MSDEEKTSLIRDMIAAAARDLSYPWGDRITDGPDVIGPDEIMISIDGEPYAITVERA